MIAETQAPQCGIPWMQEGPFGLMVHWLSVTQPREGQAISNWNDKVDAFRLEHFWSQVRQSGAKWLIFPFGQNTGRYCSPNSYLNHEFPGLCSNRDLFGEIARLARRDGIKMIGYLPSEVDAQPEETRRFWEWDAHPEDKSRFQEKYQRFIRAYAESLGELLNGWWFDGCYNASTNPYLRTQTWHNGRFDFPAWQAAARAGNPAAVLAMNMDANDGRYPFPDLDYTAGECNDLDALKCDSPLVNGRVQWHALLWIDCSWVHAEKPGLIAPPRFTLDELHAFVGGAHANGGGVTLNIGIYEDGSLADPSLDQLAALSERMRHPRIHEPQRPVSLAGHE